jgi:histidine triad (HIT) family protein
MAGSDPTRRQKGCGIPRSSFGDQQYSNITVQQSNNSAIQPHPPMQNCIFCQIVRGESPSWKVLETDAAYAFLDINPVSKYHTLIIPKRHARDIFDISEEDLRAVMDLVRSVAKLYEEKLGIRNVQLICSNGAEAQQDVFHIHFHIVPRRRGDGQSIRWTTHPEWRSEFDALLEKVQ